MTFTPLTPLPDLEKIREKFPLSAQAKKNVAQNRTETQNILTQKDDRFLVIIGPCSAWPNTSVLEYAKKLALATKPIENKIKIVLRVYTQKPRTTFGWKGTLLHPDPFGSPDILAGIEYSRKMMVDIIEKTGLPIADEVLYPDLCLQYLGDLYSYGCIGARSTEHQRKRMIASGIDHPMGMKNPTSGDLTKAVQSVAVAQAKHKMFPHIGNIVETSGNPWAHLVLRGGGGRPNYYPHVLDLATQLLIKQNIQNPSIIVDVSHENSIGIDGKKDYKNQTLVAEKVLAYRKKIPGNFVKGLMVESFVNSGNQKDLSTKASYQEGVSLTDGCLSWKETEHFLQTIIPFFS